MEAKDRKPDRKVFFANEINFRNEARNAVDRARAHLATEEAQHLRYAALELRMAFEALTYDRAQAFAAELPPSEYDTWQPRKLLQILLDIDPLADKDSTISFGIEPEYGVPPDEMQLLGSEKVLNAAVLKKHYDALGNHLHMPTIRQFREGKGPDAAKLAKRYAGIIEFLDDVLASILFNCTLGVFAEIACDRCKNMIRKRMPPGTKSVKARCFECSAGYTVESGESGQVLWTPNQQQVKCANPDCAVPTFVWSDEIAPGKFWTCSVCSSKNLICLGVVLDQPQ